MKECPYCAENIQDRASVCRFCGKDVSAANAAKPKMSRILLNFLLNPLFLLVAMVYTATQFDWKLSGNESLLFIGAWIVLFFVANNVRQKFMSAEEIEAEREEADYWEGRGR